MQVRHFRPSVRFGSTNRRIPWLAARRGIASLEVIATMAMMFPVAVILLSIGIRLCIYLYQAIEVLVTWPYL